VTTRAELIWDVGAELGEGPIWMPEESALRFVDIKAGRLHRYTPATGAKETLPIGGQPSFVLPCTDGRLIVGSDNGVYVVEHQKLGACIARVDMPTNNRTNDAAADCFGRLWFGTMDNDERHATGKLYCLDAGVLHCVGCDAIVTNGPAISADGSTLYHVDSSARTIWRYAVSEGPRVERGEVFFQFSEADGYPDGIVLDSEDCLWVALWEGWCVRRYAPDGALLLQVDLPCARVTKIALGGEKLRTAYVTTARVGLSGAELVKQPLAGALFAFDAPAPGRPTPRIRL
jgi:D-xylonolactonase